MLQTKACCPAQRVQPHSTIGVHGGPVRQMGCLVSIPRWPSIFWSHQGQTPLAAMTFSQHCLQVRAWPQGTMTTWHSVHSVPELVQNDAMRGSATGNAHPNTEMQILRMDPSRDKHPLLHAK
jgi:hypothetical protein